MSLIQNSFEIATGLPEFVGYILFFALGSIIGSFLNVVIHRVPNDESIVYPNSACPHCKNQIKPYDNIPILSWLFLGGKCRNCKSPISPRYPAVELLTGLLFLLVFWQIGLSWFLPVCLIFAASLVALIFIDAEHMILPDVINYPLLVFALIVRVTFAFLFGNQFFADLNFFPVTYFEGFPLWALTLVSAVFGGLVGGGSLWLLGEIWKRLRGVDAMGLGDVKMMFAVGALLGWRLTFLAMFIGAFAGAVAGIFVIIRQKDKDFQTQIPFGIFLGIGSLVALLFGEQIINWYLGMFPQ
jgi:leader peptidase (prepilin peptidase)/N-methyltransferase